MIVHRWVVLEIRYEDEAIYKLLAGWNGSYLEGDSWSLNSGIAKVEKNGDYFDFHGHSGSLYSGHVNAYGVNLASGGALAMLIKKFPDTIKTMPEDTDWENLLEG